MLSVDCCHLSGGAVLSTGFRLNDVLIVADLAVEGVINRLQWAERCMLVGNLP
jgi:hypothetical protein